MIVGGINTKDISVVVQGAVDEVNTPVCLNNIRRHLKGATIILSTWKGTNVKGLDYDEVVFSEDPGSTKDDYTCLMNNMNRQFRSTRNGLEAVKTKYAIKIRSDIILTSNHFLRYFEQFQKRNKKYQIFKHRVLFCSYFFKRYLGDTLSYINPVPLHMSDWFAFGYTSDIREIFEIELAEEPQYTNYLNIHDEKMPMERVYFASYKFPPEQYLLLNCVRKHFKDFPRFDDIRDFSVENIQYADNIVINNFIIINPKQISLYCGKNGNDPYKKWTQNELKLPHELWEGLYRFDVFENNYKKYCDKRYTPSLRGKFQVWKYLTFYKLFETWK